jgi:hypothetical protein
MVQAVHVAQEAGAYWGVPPKCHLVLLQAQNQEALRYVRSFCALHRVETVVFDEPDPIDGDTSPMGGTALCTSPLPPEAHRLFRRFPLWTPREPF